MTISESTPTQLSMKLLTIKELAAHLSMSKSKIYGLVAEGKFPRPVCQRPRFSRWSAIDVARWVECQRRQEEWSGVENPAADPGKAAPVAYGRRKSDQPFGRRRSDYESDHGASDVVAASE